MPSLVLPLLTSHLPWAATEMEVGKGGGTVEVIKHGRRLGPRRLGPVGNLLLELRNDQTWACVCSVSAFCLHSVCILSALTGAGWELRDLLKNFV